MGLEILRETSLNAHIKQQKQRQKTSPDAMSAASRAPSLTTIHNYIDEHSEILRTADDINFNGIKFAHDLGRKSALSVLTYHILQRLSID